MLNVLNPNSKANTIVVACFKGKDFYDNLVIFTGLITDREENWWRPREKGGTFLASTGGFKIRLANHKHIFGGKKIIGMPTDVNQ